MEDDLKELSASSGGPHLSYVEVRDANRMQRACERWPLLAAIAQNLVASTASPSSPTSLTRTNVGAVALWEL